MLEFKSKKRNKKINIENVKEQIRRQNIKELAHFLIDSYEGDFAIIFKTKGIEHIFDDVEKDAEFIVAISDVEKTKVSNPDYFFKNFSERQYFGLDS